ncbi:MAG: hypothetical protein KF780_04790 [Sphingomonas sp.]|nr:hypothetical protein [Sphingomonas sp.]
MQQVALFLIAALTSAAPALAQPDVERGFAGVLRGCEEWVLQPASWVDGAEPFIAAVGLGNEMSLVENVPEVSLPPTELRHGNHYWHVNSTEDAGYFLVVSDQLPMCHITGGGNTDLQPAIEAILASETFGMRWRQISDSTREGMITTVFQHRENESFSIAISRARQPNQRLDRVQVLATATYSTTSR